jgi:hypothetical protein
MNTPSFLKNMTQLEMAVAALMIVYVLLPIEVPDSVCRIVDGPVGMIVIFAVAVYLFFNANSLIAVIFLLAGYELLRRCCNNTGTPIVIMKYTPTQARKDEKMKKMNPPPATTLEEEVVEKMAPVGRSEPAQFITTEFSPVADNVGSASMYV